MNRLWSRPWFFGSVGAFGYLTGMNDALLGWLGTGWLELGRWGQTAAVLAALALAAYFTQGALSRRRSALRSAVRAADATRLQTTAGPVPGDRPDPRGVP